MNGAQAPIRAFVTAMNRLILPLFAFPLLALAACAPASEEAPEPRGNGAEAAPAAPAAAPGPARAESVGAAVSAFGLNLYRELAERPGNLFVSPVSIAGAFGPVLAGARGETEQAIGTTLRLPEAGETHARLGGLLRGLERSGDGTSLSIANAVWLQHGFAAKPNFAAVARTQYDAAVNNLRFEQPEQAASRINAWVTQETEGRIPELVAPSMLGPDTRLVVTNAVWFLGDWAHAFAPGATRPAPFRLSGGESVEAPLMQRTGEYRYVERAGLQILDLPYKDDRLAMTAFLPAEPDGLPAFERGLDAERLDALLEAVDASEPRRVRVLLPKLELNRTYDLKAPLKAMGMAPAFAKNADFSAIADMPLWIEHVVHKTFLKVDEKGTEAAAATGVVVQTVSVRPQPPEFRADRPFFFVIRDKETGTVIFLGRIADPTA